MNIVTATREYEAWLTAAIPHPLVPDDLDYKHALMADPRDPFPFFRSTYYRWAMKWAELAGPLADAPRVLAVGDIHVENFGTWRDADGRLCWGVNDFDEADELPYTQDLVRLAASVRCAKRGGSLTAKLSDACAAILDGYRTTIAAGGRAFVLEEHHPHLRKVAMDNDRAPRPFWADMEKLLKLPQVDVPDDAVAALAGVLPDTGLTLNFRPRPEAGMGSLGRPRFVALAEWAGGWVCREAKAAAPPATAWALGLPTPNRAAEVLGGAKRSPDPFYRPGERWVARRLAPRSQRIALKQLKRGNVRRVLRAMGAEIANVHLGTPGMADAIADDLHRRPEGWLLTAAKTMADALEADWREWRAGHAGYTG